MVRALFPDSNRCPRLRALNAASWALMPFQPTAVSTANFGIAEVRTQPAFNDAGVLVTKVQITENLLRLRMLKAASWALMPFQPTTMSTANFGIAEVSSLSALHGASCSCSGYILIAEFPAVGSGHGPPL